jgi:hypothetical protein
MVQDSAQSLVQQNQMKTVGIGLWGHIARKCPQCDTR